ncbi:MAG: hypothetical protein M3325_14680, partial [Actinomycetota bacterium]|nr:hypothetical protein [Actinomycetota bacterium]
MRKAFDLLKRSNRVLKGREQPIGWLIGMVGGDACDHRLTPYLVGGERVSRAPPAPRNSGSNQLG